MLPSKEILYEFLKKENWLMDIGQPTSYEDKNGQTIIIGDEVEYFFAAHPISNNPLEGSYASDDSDGVHSRMNDVVVRTAENIYFVDPEFGSGFASCHAKHCKVIGSFVEYFLERRKMEFNGFLEDFLERIKTE